MYCILTGWHFSAEETERPGVASLVVPTDKLMEESKALAAKIAANPRLAVLAGKETVNQVAEDWKLI